MEFIYAQVTFILKEDVEDALRARAREVDEEMGNDPESEYSIPQALQVVWHGDPDWLHKNALMGWTLDKWLDEDGYRMVWA